MSVVDGVVRPDASEMIREAGEGRRIVLHEWSTERWRLDGGMARRLGEMPWISVATDREPGCWKVSTRQWVGAFSLGDLRVIVRPKIKPDNLFLLLEVGLPSEAWQAEAIDYETNDELLPALVSFFARTTETTLARGLFHHYRHEEDDLLALRGRIDFVRQFRRGGVVVPMASSWDDFTADVDENRCLTAAIRLALRVPGVPHDDRRRLRRLLAALDGVAEPAASVALDCLGRIQYSRLNEHYRPALRLARLILTNCTLQDQHGDTAASAFMLDMNELFERFVTARLQRKLGGQFDVQAQVPSIFGKKQVLKNGRKRVNVKPDLLLRRSSQAVGVADIKYKLAARDKRTDPDGAYGRAADYYQLLAYATALELNEGTLIYCADVNRDESGEFDASVNPDRVSSDTGEASEHGDGVTALAKSTITVQHAGTKLHAAAVDLSGSPSDIDAQVAALADHLARSANLSITT